jgi:hypothetical protein
MAGARLALLLVVFHERPDQMRTISLVSLLSILFLATPAHAGSLFAKLFGGGKRQGQSQNVHCTQLNHRESGALHQLDLGTPSSRVRKLFVLSPERETKIIRADRSNSRYNETNVKFEARQEWKRRVR